MPYLLKAFARALAHDSLVNLVLIDHTGVVLRRGGR